MLYGILNVFLEQDSIIFFLELIFLLFIYLFEGILEIFFPQNKNSQI